jgi:hypothetical protein
MSRADPSEDPKDSDLRKGSRGREYCENLQKLIFLVVNGSVPSGSTSEFLAAVKPLIQQLLQKWEIGNLRQVFSNLRGTLRGHILNIKFRSLIDLSRQGILNI